MDSHLQQILDGLPEDGARSRLEPYREFIMRLRRQRRTYRRIREILAEKCGVRVATSTLQEFVEKRSRPPSKPPELEPPLLANVMPLNRPDDPYAEARERMRKHKEEPMASKPKKVFEIPESDSIEPLILRPETQKEK